MAFTRQFGTGFECGTREINGASNMNHANMGVITTTPRTGTYCWRAYGISGGNYYTRWNVTGTPSKLMISAWIRINTATTAGMAYLGVTLSDGTKIGIQFDTRYWDAYVNGSKVADGTKPIWDYTRWHHVQLYVYANDSGKVYTKIDGQADISYSGDTVPSTATDIDYVYFWADNKLVTYEWHIDDFTYGTADSESDWPGDIRYDVLLPTADTATQQWDMSTGSTAYSLVDEVAPSDTDNIYTGTNGEQSIHSLGDWTGTGKTPQWVNIWVRAKKDAADASDLKIIDSDGSNTRVGSAVGLTTAYAHYLKVITTNPDGSALSDAGIDGLQVGVESVI